MDNNTHNLTKIHYDSKMFYQCFGCIVFLVQNREKGRENVISKLKKIISIRLMKLTPKKRARVPPKDTKNSVC